MGKNEMDIAIKIGSMGLDLFQIKYPQISFPRKCVVCGKEAFGMHTQTVQYNKVLSSTSNGVVRTKKTLPIEMKLEIPVCEEEQRNIEKAAKRVRVVMPGMAAIGAILSLVLFSKDIFKPNTTDLTPILVMVIGGLLLGWAGMKLIDLICQGLKKPRLFYNRPYAFEILDSYMQPAARLHVRIDNESIFSEFKELNKGA
jgi:hypothetical protein